MPSYQIILGDSREALKALPDASVDAVVCDPPYGLGKQPDTAEVLRAWLADEEFAATGGGFMGARWDAFVPGPAVWRECFRVLKPGGHLLAFFGTRTSDMGSVAIRLAGFEIRDLIAWVYGTGFPKSHDVSKGIDKAAGAERKVVGSKAGLPGYREGPTGENEVFGSGLANGSAKCAITAPATDAARQWGGWDTCLKPALEPIVFARKPLIGTVVANVLAHGTGALNINACRVPGAPDAPRTTPATANGNCRTLKAMERAEYVVPEGRWPANLIHDGSDEVVAAFPHTQSGAFKRSATATSASGRHGIYGTFKGAQGAHGTRDFGPANSGSAARFFYSAKASKADRDPGNDHPTVKPQALCRWLCRLVVPPGGTVLDPFMGSGSTGVAALAEGFGFIGVEMDPHYHAIAARRLAQAEPEHTLALAA